MPWSKGVLDWYHLFSYHSGTYIESFIFFIPRVYKHLRIVLLLTLFRPICHPGTYIKSHQYQYDLKMVLTLIITEYTNILLSSETLRFVWYYYLDTSQIGSLTSSSIWCIISCIHQYTSLTLARMLQVGTNPRELHEGHCEGQGLRKRKEDQPDSQIQTQQQRSRPAAPACDGEGCLEIVK